MSPFGRHLGRPGGQKPIKTNGFLTFLHFAFLAILASTGTLSGHLGGLLGPSWRLLAPIWAPQRLPLRPLGSPWASLGALQTPLGVLLWPSWGGPGCPVEPPWCCHEPFWRSQMAFLFHFGTILHHFSSNLHRFRIGWAHAKHGISCTIFVCWLAAKQRIHKHALE